MDVSALAANLLTLSAAKTQQQANIAVLKKQFEMQRSVLDPLAPAKPPAPPGMGQLVDRTA